MNMQDLIKVNTARDLYGDPGPVSIKHATWRALRLFVSPSLRLFP